MNSRFTSLLLGRAQSCLADGALLRTAGASHGVLQLLLAQEVLVSLFLGFRHRIFADRFATGEIRAACNEQRAVGVRAAGAVHGCGVLKVIHLHLAACAAGRVARRGGRAASRAGNASSKRASAAIYGACARVAAVAAGVCLADLVPALAQLRTTGWHFA